MGRLSDDVMNNFLEAYFGNRTPSIPATYYVGLSTSQPTNVGGSVSEPSGGSYARVAVTNDATNWNTASARTITNKTKIQFPTATADWGNITHFAIYNSASGTTAADFVAWGALDQAVTIVSGGTPDFPAGAVTIEAPGA